MKYIVIMFLAIIPITTLGQTYSSSVSDSAIVSFIKWEVKNGEKYREGGKLRLNKKARIIISQYDSINFYLTDGVNRGDWQYDLYLFNRRNNIDSLFSDSEKDSLFNQFTTIKDTVWTHRIKGAKWRKWKKPKNTYSYAVPLFSSDGQYVMIKKSFYCGNICAYGGIYLYTRTEDNSWELLKILNGWMS
ncbi:MAG: hypothetical protein ACJA1C_001999 [Crocinitomicaceae bacterium]|jgi:hypothetical protein